MSRGNKILQDTAASSCWDMQPAWSLQETSCNNGTLCNFCHICGQDDFRLCKVEKQAFQRSLKRWQPQQWALNWHWPSSQWLQMFTEEFEEHWSNCFQLWMPRHRPGQQQLQPVSRSTHRRGNQAKIQPGKFRLADICLKQVAFSGSHGMYRPAFGESGGFVAALAIGLAHSILLQ